MLDDVRGDRPADRHVRRHQVAEPAVPRDVDIDDLADRRVAGVLRPDGRGVGVVDVEDVVVGATGDRVVERPQLDAPAVGREPVQRGRTTMLEGVSHQRQLARRASPLEPSSLGCHAPHSAMGTPVASPTCDGQLGRLRRRRLRPRRPAAGDRVRRRRAPTSCIYDMNPTPSTQVNAGEMPFDEPGRRRASSSGCSIGRTLLATDRSRGRSARREPWSSSSARPSTSTSTPTPTPCPRRDRRELADALPRRPAPRPAQHRLPGGHRAWSSGCSTRLGRRHRRRLLPRADRRGQGVHGAVLAAADRVRAAPTRREAGRASCSGT